MHPITQSQEVAYNAELVKQLYDKRYSAFQFLPSFSTECKKTIKTFKNIFTRYKINHTSHYSHLDLGCGIGLKTYCLSSFFKSSKGVDISERAIQIASLFNDKPTLTFEVSDVNTPSSVQKFDLVTTLGLSVLNISDMDQYCKEISFLLKQYVKDPGYLIVHSFTDYSGKAPTGWYNHTKNQFDMLIKYLSEKNIKCTLYFPHKYIRNYVGYGVTIFLTEIYKILKSKRKDYYIIIEKQASI